eukprot:gb/GECH01010705.1/.p1 GENE.gb/GECH01010705.1/~~gb/GECH01010705.1/.p1  ORF type:complete len:372 (+),score=66.16 gb/GECH01010705.1/:1-1116(+)
MNGDHQNYSISSNDPGHFFLISDDDSSSSSNSSCTIFPSSSNKRESISSADENSPRLVFVPPSPDESDSSTDSLDSGVIQEGTFDPSRIGQGYQAVIPDLKTKPHKVPVQDEKRAGTQVWSSRQISNRKIDDYLFYVSRYCSKEKAFEILNRCNYDIGAARGYILENYQSLEFLSEDQKWTPEEREIFDDGLCQFGKDLHKINSLLPHKKYGQLVNFYYRNKRKKSVYSHKYFYDQVPKESVNDYILMDDNCSESFSIQEDNCISSLSSSPAPSTPPSPNPDIQTHGFFQHTNDEFLTSDTAFTLERSNQDISPSLLMESSTSTTTTNLNSTSEVSLCDDTWELSTSAQQECNISLSDSNEDRLFSLVNQL